MPGTYNLPDLPRGDTFLAFAIATLTDRGSGAAIAVSSARMMVRSKPSGTRLQVWDSADATLTISGAGSNVITLAALASAVTRALPIGTHDYDLKVVLAATGQTLTLLAGTWKILPAITY